MPRPSNRPRQRSAGGAFSCATGILNNELYIGRLVWNRLRYVKDPETGKRVSRLNPPEAWVFHEVPELRIVPQDLWERVKVRQEAVRRNTRPDRQERPLWDRRRPRYLFSGLVKCGSCGGGFVVISKTLYGCATARNKGTCDNWLNMRRDVLEASVLNGLKSHLMEPELFKAFADEFTRELNRLRNEERSRLDQTMSELATVERRTRKIVDAIAEGVPARALNYELLALEKQEDELKAQLARAEPAKPLVHPSLAELYRRKVADLHEALQAEDTRAEAAEIIRGLVEEIVLTPEDGELRIDLKGELVGILALGSENKSPAAISRDGHEQIKMVAGGGFEPPTFRL